MAYKAELTISFGAPSFLSLLTFSSAGLTLSCVGVGSLASGSPITRFSDYDTDHVGTILVMIVTSRWREYFAGTLLQ